MASKLHDAVQRYSVKGKVGKASVSYIMDGPTARSVLPIGDVELLGYSFENFSKVYIGFDQYVDLAAEICGFSFSY